MEAVAAVAFGVAVVALFWWLDADTAKREAKEDKELADDIKHLPEEAQHRIWHAHYRLRAERDLF